MNIKFGLKTYELISDFTPIDPDRDVAKVKRNGKTYIVSKYVENFPDTVISLPSVGYSSGYFLWMYR